jgi:iron complex outermembrane recepter protein
MTVKRKPPNALTVAVIAAIGVGASQNALSQQAAGAGTSGGLEEIVVTATRRTANLQDVPIAIVAMSGEDLEVQGIETIERLQGTIPNLSVIGGTNGSAFSSNFSIRGIPRVGFYVDGIWLPFTTGLAEFALNNVERIEVLRGPQGTLYGRDSTGGSIRVVTKAPQDEFGGTASLNMGSYNRRDAFLDLNVPLAESVKTRISVSSQSRDGYVHSNAINEDLGQIDMTNVGADLLWTPTDRFDLRFKISEMTDHTEDARVSLWHVPQGAKLVGFEYGATDLYTLAGARVDSQTVVAGYPGGNLGQWESNLGDWMPGTTEVTQSSVEMHLDLTDNITLTSQTGYIDFFRASLLDWDNSQWQIVETYSETESSLVSQEFQIAGNNGRFDWVGGVYYWDQKARTHGSTWGFEEFKDGRLNRNAVLATPQCMAPTTLAGCAAVFNVYQGIGNGDSLTENTENGYAVFGEVVVTLTEKLNLTAGARYHKQDIATNPLGLIRGLSAFRAPKPGPYVGGDPFAGYPLPNPIVTTFDAFTTRLAADYSFSDDVMGYVSYSEGFNAGGASTVDGFVNNATSRILIPFDPENIQTYEVGMRSDFADGRLRLNATLFHTDWEDIQLRSNYVNPSIGLYAITIITQNVAGADADGVEAEITWLATDNLRLNLNLGLLDTAYTTFKQGAATPVNSGDAFAQAPKQTYSVGLQHTASLSGGGTLVSRLDYSYVSGFQRYADPKYHPDYLGLTALLGEYEAGEYGLVNARLVYTPAVGNWDLSVYGSNLTDEQVINGGFYGSIWETDWSTVGRPREFGVQLKVAFD